MNNRDWLYTLQPRDLARWFDAEHVEPNDDSEPKDGVSDQGSGSNDACMAQDSRDKLEEDVRNHIAISITPNKPDDGVLAPVSTVIGWLDRQEAITERECADCTRGMGAYADSLCDPLKERIDELQAEVDGLTAERDLWRERCGQMLDAANELARIAEVDDER